jgi:hypothetical protein
MPKQKVPINREVLQARILSIHNIEVSISGPQNPSFSGHGLIPCIIKKISLVKIHRK